MSDVRGDRDPGDDAISLADVRHELRTPVGHIIGYAEIVAEDGADLPSEEAARDLATIAAIGQRLLALIDTHLGEGRTTVSDAEIARAHFEFRALLNDVAGYASMLRDDALEQGRQDLVDDLDHIVDAEARLLDLVDRHLSDPSSSQQRGQSRPERTAPQEGEGATRPLDLPDVARCSTGDGGSILVVDDDAANRDLLVRRLAGQGYEPVAVSSGAQALDWLSEHRPDLVLLDLLMPDMSGDQVLEQIRQDRSLASVPVIMLSAADRPNDVVRCIALGAEDFVPKPFNPILLRARISAVLEKHRLRAEASARLKVFVSSPGDVIPERRVVKQVITDLNEQYVNRAVLVPVLWEEEPLLASDTFQAQIRSAADCDIYVGIFWSRIGSMLPSSIRRADGSRYESGTAFELEEALAGHAASGRPDVLVYRKRGAPTMSLADADEVLERLEQMRRLESYLEGRFREDDGTYRSAFHEFSGAEELEAMLPVHLGKLIDGLLGAGVD